MNASNTSLYPQDWQTAPFFFFQTAPFKNSVIYTELLRDTKNVWRPESIPKA